MAVNKNSVVNIAGYKFEPLVDPVDLVLCINKSVMSLS